MSKILLGNQRLTRLMRVQIVLLGVWALICIAFAEITLADTTDDLFNVGFSRSTIGAVNENDAKVAIRIWAQRLVHEKNISANPEPIIFKNIVEIKKALTLGEVDCLNLTTPEYFTVQNLMKKDFMIASVVDGSIEAEYVVLVNKKKDFKKLADLQGRSLRCGGAVRDSLALIWLDTDLVGRGFNSSTDFFGKIRKMAKNSDVVLPVFFGKVDACIVTRKVFELMVELNPQIGKQLRVLATSPPFVPVIFGFRTDFSSLVQGQVTRELLTWHKSPAGRQILTMFQTESLEQQSRSCLDDTLALLKEHQRLFGSIESM